MANILDEVILLLVNELDESDNPYLFKEIKKVVTNHSLLAVGSAWIPVPGLDLAAAATNIWTMYLRINSKLNLKFDSNALKTIASGVLTNLGAYATGMGVGSTLKFIPGIGSITGGIIVSGINYSIVYASAFVYIKIISTLVKKTKSSSHRRFEEIKIDPNDLRYDLDFITKDESLMKQVMNEGKSEYREHKDDKVE